MAAPSRSIGRALRPRHALVAPPAVQPPSRLACPTPRAYSASPPAHRPATDAPGPNLPGGGSQQDQRPSATTTPPSEFETHFGFRRVRNEDKAGLVGGVFSSVASSYDLMNDAMSAGIHRVWKDEFVKALDPRGGIKVLDVAGGTGDIAERILDHARTRHRDRATSVRVLDINPNMLRQGQRRMVQSMYWNTPQLSFSLGNAEDLRLIMPQPVPPATASGAATSGSGGGDADAATQLRRQVRRASANSPPLPPLLTEAVEDETMDLYTIAYGIRNVTDIQAALNEAYRVLKPGGVFGCLEFSRPPNPVLRELYRAYSFNVIPMLGELLASDRASYQYLVESIQRFPSQPDFARMLRRAGFALPGADADASRWGGVLRGFGRQASSDGDAGVDGCWRDMSFGITTMWVGFKAP